MKLRLKDKRKKLRDNDKKKKMRSNVKKKKLRDNDKKKKMRDNDKRKKQLRRNFKESRTRELPQKKPMPKKLNHWNALLLSIQRNPHECTRVFTKTMTNINNQC